MVAWNQRHVTYKLCFCGLLASSLAYIVGFSCPYWGRLELDDYGYYDQAIGLWQVCSVEVGTCTSYVNRNNPSWINASRGLCAIALVFFIFSTITGFVSFCTVMSVSSRYSECLALIAVVAGVVGSVIFGARFHQMYMGQPNIGVLEWGFVLVVASLATAAVCACVMLVFSRRLVRPPSSGCVVRGARGCRVTIVLQGAEGGGDVVHLPYFGDVQREQLVYGAGPVLPPSYEMVTRGIANPDPQAYVDAPPPYSSGKSCATATHPPPAYHLPAASDAQKQCAAVDKQ